MKNVDSLEFRRVSEVATELRVKEAPPCKSARGRYTLYTYMYVDTSRDCENWAGRNEKFFMSTTCSKPDTAYLTFEGARVEFDIPHTKNLIRNLNRSQALSLGN